MLDDMMGFTLAHKIDLKSEQSTQPKHQTKAISYIHKIVANIKNIITKKPPDAETK
jgi:hypothetical protein